VGWRCSYSSRAAMVWEIFNEEHKERKQKGKKGKTTEEDKHKISFLMKILMKKGSASKLSKLIFESCTCVDYGLGNQ